MISGDRLKSVCFVVLGAALCIVVGITSSRIMAAAKETAANAGEGQISPKLPSKEQQRFRFDFVPASGATSSPFSGNKSNKNDSLSTSTIKASFKIMQLTDLHLGDKKPENDQKTFALLKRIIPLENPDFIVMSGHQLTGKNVDENATAYYDLIGDFLDPYQIPYTMLFGGDDDESFETSDSSNGTVKVKRHHKGKTPLYQLIQSNQKHAYSMTQQYLNHGVLHVSWRGRVKLQMFFFDTSWNDRMPFASGQLDWFRANRGPKLDKIVFQHMPIRQQVFQTDRCSGFTGGPEIESLERGIDVLQTFQEDGFVHFMAAGHNHHQSYCCSSGSDSVFHMCFGRHSGYGGYGGNWDRGARVYEIQIEEPSDKLKWRSWTRLESGEAVDLYDPTMKSSAR